MRRPSRPDMYDALLPFGAILAGSGFGQILKRYVSSGKGIGSWRQGRAERPRIQVTGPKVQVETCQICMGKIKEGTEYVRCTSGKVFHAICLARVGDCPYCRRTVAVKGRESETSRDFILVRTSEPLPSFPVTPEKTPPNPCPVCGEELEIGAQSCTCGVIFVTDGGTFTCPSCGEEVVDGSPCCVNCGERFEQLPSLACPACGRSVTAATEACICGAILNNLCPECGGALGEADSVCPNCGSEFEFI